MLIRMNGYAVPIEGTEVITKGKKEHLYFQDPIPAIAVGFELIKAAIALANINEGEGNKQDKFFAMIKEYIDKLPANPRNDSVTNCLRS